MSKDPTPAIKGAQVASELVPAASILGDDEQDTVLLREMSEDAQAVHFLLSVVLDYS
jgi:hypothetical protein